MRSAHESAEHRILVIDDNREVHVDFRKILRPELPAGESLDALAAGLFDDEAAPPAAVKGPDFRVDSALQGEEGLGLLTAALAEGKPYAMAFVDMRMPPGWDGVETIKHLWATDPDLQVVICSAYSDYSWSDIIRHLGSSDRLLILKKPFDNIEVVQMASAFTRKWALHQQTRLRTRGLEQQVAEEVLAKQKVESALRLAQKLEAVGRLAAGVAHEINTPIQYVGDSVHFLSDAVKDVGQILGKYDDLHRAVREGTTTQVASDELTRLRDELDVDYLLEQMPRAVERSLEGVERVGAIVRSMKAFAYPDRGEMTSTDLNSAITTTLTVARNEYKYVAELETELGELPLVTCHLGEFNQVILNLVVNAAHAIGDIVAGTDRKGRIRVSTRLDGDAAVVAISDSGGGIPEAIQARIFDPFFTTKEVGKGTGQGLAIAHSVIVEKHRGELWFETRRGEGTTFYVRLPVEPVIHDKEMNA